MCVPLTLDRDDELWDNREHFVGAGTEHVVHPLLREEGVGHLQLTQAVEEDRQVVVEVELKRLRRGTPEYERSTRWVRLRRMCNVAQT